MPFDDELLENPEPGPELNALTQAVIGAAIEVHRNLGPGLDEGCYERAMCVEFKLRAISFVRQVVIEVGYKGEIIGEKRIDLIVAGKLVVELKAIEQLNSVHQAQLNTYLKITRLTLGLLINFNVLLLKDGIRRVIRSDRN
jgi:GxxExxY protein